MREFQAGDFVAHYTEKDGIEYLYVAKVENGKLFCCDMEDYHDYAGTDYIFCYTEELKPEEVEYLPPVEASEEDIVKFLRYEQSFEEIFGKVEPRARLKAEKLHYIDAEELLSILQIFKHKYSEKILDEWLRPMSEIMDGVWQFKELKNDEDGYNYLPPMPSLNGIFWQINGRTNIDELIGELLNLMAWQKLPVAERNYDDATKEEYIDLLDSDEMRLKASDKDIALFVQYIEELCAKNNKRALYAKAYSCYGGNRAYRCDWHTSRDLLLKLMELDDNPYLANTLGYIYYYGRCSDGTPDYEAAFYYFSIGAAGGVDESRYKLADMFVRGRGVKENKRIAATIISELYKETLKDVQKMHVDGKFADVAFRLGNYHRDGIYFDQSYDMAYHFYLQASFAIRMRQQAGEQYGDARVAAGIERAINEVLPQTSFTEPVNIIYDFANNLFRNLLNNATRKRQAMEVIIKRENNEFSLCFRVLPRGFDKTPQKFFITVPAAHFCGYLENVTLHTQPTPNYKLKIDGKYFKGDTAKVIFDYIDYGKLYLYGREVLSYSGLCSFKVPSAEMEQKYKFASVVLDNSNKHYDYLCDIPDVQAGDKVIVNVRNEETAATVVSTFEKSKSEMKLPLSKYKPVLRKA
ncbi:MAG: hypothetical protein K6G50_01045 [bacterium]|nr:hypothetical protein [bacterium]